MGSGAVKLEESAPIGGPGRVSPEFCSLIWCIAKLLLGRGSTLWPILRVERGLPRGRGRLLPLAMATQLSRKRAFESPEIPDRLYFKIGDVARICEVETYVLRFWESQFPQLKPNKSGTGQRLYRKRDVELALEIKRLVHAEGYTLAGARQTLEHVHRRDAEPAFAAGRSRPWQAPGLCGRGDWTRSCRAAGDCRNAHHLGAARCRAAAAGWQRSQCKRVPSFPPRRAAESAESTRLVGKSVPQGLKAAVNHNGGGVLMGASKAAPFQSNFHI